MKDLVVNNIVGIGITISISCLICAILCFKCDLLVLGFILCTIGAISFLVAVGGKG